MKITVEGNPFASMQESLEREIDVAVRQLAELTRKEMDDYSSAAAARCYCAWFERVYGIPNKDRANAPVVTK